MDPETMRAKVIADLDRRLESADDKRLLQASREYWSNVGAAELSALILLYARQP
jgi:hypothetical protein